MPRCLARHLLFLAVCFSIFFGASSVSIGAHPRILRLIASHDIDAAIDRIERRVAAGKNANQTGEDGLTALHMAANTGAVPVVALLIKHGAILNQEDDLGRTPLAVAVAGGQLAASRMLLSYGADYQLADKVGMTPLMHAVSIGDPRLVELLLVAGANVNATDIYGSDVLMHAATVRSYGGPLHEMLLENGAAIDTVDRQGYSAMYIARSRGNRELIDRLLQLGVSIEFAEARFIGQQVQVDGYFFGVQLEEPNGRCNDPRFRRSNSRGSAISLGYPAWADAEDCRDEFVSERIVCVVVFACMSRGVDEAFVQMVEFDDDYDRRSTPSELQQDYAVLFIDPDNFFLQLGFERGSVAPRQAVRIPVGQHESHLRMGAAGGLPISQSQALLGLTSIGLGNSRVAPDRELQFLTPSARQPLLIASYLNQPVGSYSQWWSQDVQFQAKPGHAYKAFADIAPDPVSAGYSISVWIMDYESAEIVYEARKSLPGMAR